MLDIINDLGAVKRTVEVDIQVVRLVGHQVAEWPVGAWECAMSRKAVSRLRRKEREGGSLGQELTSRRKATGTTACS